MATLINPLEVPPEADEAFVAGWERESALYRALRADVDFRFVEIAIQAQRESEIVRILGGIHGADRRGSTGVRTRIGSGARLGSRG